MPTQNQPETTKHTATSDRLNGYLAHQTDSTPTPTVTAVIPCYKCAKTISAVLQALLQQTVKLTEIIVVNDSSPDELELALQPYRSVITYVKNEQNMGLAYSYNAGLEKVKSEYALTLHSDCILDNDYIEKLLQHFSKNPKLAVTTGQYLFHTPKNLALSDRMFLILNRIPVETNRADKSVSLINFIEGKADIFRHTLLAKHGFFNTNLALTAEDQELSIRLRSAGYTLIQDCACRFSVCFTDTSDTILKILNKQRTYARGQAYIVIKFGRLAFSASSSNRQSRAMHRFFQLVSGLLIVTILVASIFYPIALLFLASALLARALYYIKISKGFYVRDKLLTIILGPLADLYYLFGAIEGGIKTSILGKV